jgi:hypothetical protein
MVVHICNPRIYAAVGGLLIQTSPGLHSQTLSQKKGRKRKREEGRQRREERGSRRRRSPTQSKKDRPQSVLRYIRCVDIQGDFLKFILS